MAENVMLGYYKVLLESQTSHRVNFIRSRAPPRLNQMIYIILFNFIFWPPW